MIVNSHNDWDPLEEIIVGRADHSRIATDISARSFSYANFDKADVEKLEGPYPQWVIDEANEDADGLASTLKYIDLK
jgi:glycine amidinotransferase